MEYRCNHCGHKFNKMFGGKHPVCPYCHLMVGISYSATQPVIYEEAEEKHEDDAMPDMRPFSSGDSDISDSTTQVSTPDFSGDGGEFGGGGASGSWDDNTSSSDDSSSSSDDSSSSSDDSSSSSDDS